MGERWLVITTGGTQSFIFESNKRKLNVGASRLVSQLPLWVTDALDNDAGGHPKQAAQVRVIVNISAAANVLVPDLETGRRIISTVTRRALTEAPGLQVWGSVSDQVDGDDYAGALTAAYRRHEQVRTRLPGASSRFLGLPFTARCTFTGLPASSTVPAGADDHVLVSQVAQRKWQESRPGLIAIGVDEDHPDAQELMDAILPVTRLDQSLGDTWTAVVHSDGNGLGELLIGLAEVSGSRDYPVELRAFSEALAAVSVAALQTAIIDTGRHFAPSGPWILPLVVGGDDLTAVVDARYVREFTLNYLRAFRDGTGQDPYLSAATELVSGATHLTASAGVAIVKPTHPFFRAYALAEELCASAKIVKTIAPTDCALDIQVFHESVGRTLDNIRADLRISETDRIYAGPLTLDSGTGATLPSSTAFGNTVTSLTEGILTSSERHRLRTSLTDLPRVHGPEAVWHQTCAALLGRVKVTRPSMHSRVEAFIRDTDRTHLVSAMDLVDVEAS